MRFVKQNFLIRYIYNEFLNYSVYTNLSYLWNFGVLSFFCLIIQIITGIFLAMHYVADASHAFLSVEHIMRDINYGWLIRYLHANGASFSFLCVYIHLFRNLYYNSCLKPRELLRCIGIIILISMILTAFSGYVLPWGQMSFWAATVITSLFSAVPFIGDYIVIWLWGGYSVDSATLNRFFSLHYLLPFIIIFLIILHVLVLHEKGSTNPTGLFLKEDKISFNPYYTIKDLFGIIVFLIIFFYIIFFVPNLLGHTDNYIMANPLVTPTHIVPEWYFLPFYAILRSIPNKLGGVILLSLALLFSFILPFLFYKYIRNVSYRRFSRLFFWFYFITCVLLGWIGGQSIEYPYLQLGQALTLFYFIYLIIINNTIVVLDMLLFAPSLLYAIFTIWLYWFYNIPTRLVNSIKHIGVESVRTLIKLYDNFYSWILPLHVVLITYVKKIVSKK